MSRDQIWIIVHKKNYSAYKALPIERIALALLDRQTQQRFTYFVILIFICSDIHTIKNSRQKLHFSRNNIVADVLSDRPRPQGKLKSHNRIVAICLFPSHFLIRNNFQYSLLYQTFHQYHYIHSLLLDYAARTQWKDSVKYLAFSDQSLALLFIYIYPLTRFLFFLFLCQSFALAKMTPPKSDLQTICILPT